MNTSERYRTPTARMLLNHLPMFIIRRRDWKMDQLIWTKSTALPGKPQPAQFLLEPWRNVAAGEREGQVGTEKSEL